MKTLLVCLFCVVTTLSNAQIKVDEVNNVRIGVGDGTIDSKLDLKGTLLVSDNIGVGTDTPSEKLTLRGPDVGLRLEALIDPNIYNFTITNTSNAQERVFMKMGSVKIFGDYNNRIYMASPTGGGLTFLTNSSSGTPAERMTILNNGRIGVNNTNPQFNFDISGDLRVSGLYVDSQNSPGTIGQILQSTNIGTEWVDLDVDHALVKEINGAIRLHEDYNNTSLEGDARGENSLEISTTRLLNENVAGGDYSIVLGSNSKTIHKGSIALGFTNIASGFGATSLGAQTKAFNAAAVAIGVNNIAQGLGATAIGAQADAIGYSAVAIGVESNALAKASIAIGFEANAENENSLAIGTSTNATADNAIAIGLDAQATALNSMAVGNSMVNGSSSFGVSSGTITGQDAVGILSPVTADKAVSIGRDALSLSYGEFGIGLFNENYVAESLSSFSKKDKVFDIGNGVSTQDNSSAFSVYKSGASKFHPIMDNSIFTVPNPQAGMIIFNEETESFEGHDGIEWGPFGGSKKSKIKVPNSAFAEISNPTILEVRTWVNVNLSDIQKANSELFIIENLTNGSSTLGTTLNEPDFVWNITNDEITEIVRRENHGDIWYINPSTPENRRFVAQKGNPNRPLKSISDLNNFAGLNDGDKVVFKKGEYNNPPQLQKGNVEYFLETGAHIIMNGSTPLFNVGTTEDILLKGSGKLTGRLTHLTECGNVEVDLDTWNDGKCHILNPKDGGHTILNVNYLHTNTTFSSIRGSSPANSYNFTLNARHVFSQGSLLSPRVDNVTCISNIDNLEMVGDINSYGEPLIVLRSSISNANIIHNIKNFVDKVTDGFVGTLFNVSAAITMNNCDIVLTIDNLNCTAGSLTIGGTSNTFANGAVICFGNAILTANNCNFMFNIKNGLITDKKYIGIYNGNFTDSNFIFNAQNLRLTGDYCLFVAEDLPISNNSSFIIKGNYSVSHSLGVFNRMTVSPEFTECSIKIEGDFIDSSTDIQIMNSKIIVPVTSKVGISSSSIKLFSSGLATNSSGSHMNVIEEGGVIVRNSAFK